MMRSPWCLLVHCCLHFISAVIGEHHQRTMKVLESTVKAGEFGRISGARLTRGSVAGDSAILDGFTVCARFKLKIMGSFVGGNDNRGIVFKVPSLNDVRTRYKGGGIRR